MDVDMEYVILQNNYRKLFANQENIFPREWYNVQEYELKKKILEECLTEKIQIQNSKYYKEFRQIALS